jgi:reactive intermediate/imine deaminase
VALLDIKHDTKVFFYSSSHELGNCSGRAMLTEGWRGVNKTGSSLAGRGYERRGSFFFGVVVMDQYERGAQFPQTMNPAGLGTPGGHYSHVSIANGLIFVSGQLPIDASGAKLTDRPFEAQAEQVLENLASALAGAGSDVKKLAQVRVYIVDVAHWASFNEIYARWAGDARPARAVVPVPALHFGLKIEIEAVALV